MRVEVPEIMTKTASVEQLLDKLDEVRKARPNSHFRRTQYSWKDISAGKSRAAA